jgi:hypothetical protein
MLPLRAVAGPRICRAKSCWVVGVQEDGFAARVNRAVFNGSAQRLEDSIALATVAADTADRIDETGIDTSVTPLKGAQSAMKRVSAKSLNGR